MLQLTEVFSAPASRALSDQIADQLRKAIMTGQLKPGQHLVEHELATAMDMSRGPVRDALRILEQEHLVVRYPYRGTFVTGLTRQDAEEIYSFREALEMLAVRYVIARATDEQLGELDQLVDTMATRARTNYTQIGATELDLDFHHLLCRIAGHRRLLMAWESLQTQVRMLILTHRLLQPQDFEQRGVDFHRELVRSLRQRDLTLARITMQRHLASSYETILVSFDAAPALAAENAAESDSTRP